ncbi:MAG: insulinase family protein, partial [Calditrichaeota bacterium]
MNRKPLLLVVGLMLALVLGCRRTPENMVLLPVADDPTISFRLLFKVGSQNDPQGKEGLAVLTASLLTQGATQKHSYEEILELLYPMAASIEAQVDKEMTVIYGRIHKDNLEAFYQLLKEVVLEPAFDEDDFRRVKSDQLNYIQKSLRYAQDEELGKEVLYEFIFQGTPYRHNEEGTVKGVEAITLEDVKQFYRQHYTRANLLIGLGGGFDQA